MTTNEHRKPPAMYGITRAPIGWKKHPPMARRQRADIIMRNNRSGVSGVQHRKSHAGDPGTWIATTYAGEGRYLRSSFSVRKHGETEARALAIAARQEQLAQVKQARALGEQRSKHGSQARSSLSSGNSCSGPLPL